MTDSSEKVDKIEKSAKRGRSHAYPSLNLERAIGLMEKLTKQLGKGPYNRESVAGGLGFKNISGASASAIGALTHFGLLERNGGSYKRSELTERILSPTSDEEKRIGIIDALNAPTLYSSLIKKYNNQALPLLLNNILQREYGILQTASTRAVQVFRESAEYAGILKNGVITTEYKEVSQNEISEDEETRQGNIQTQTTILPSKKVLKDVVEFPLEAGVRLIVPSDVMSAFALGEFAVELKALRDKLTAWAEAPGEDNE
ncbi:MAG: hypothetical protein WC477_04660 [Patescibacteria group bacterium]